MGLNILGFCCCCLSLLTLTHDGSFHCVLLSLFVSLGLFFSLHLCVSWMLSSKEELCLLFLRAMGCYWPGTFSFLSSIQGPLLHPGFSGSNMSFLPALWFSAFIIRPTLEIFLILWVSDNARNNILYAGSSVLLIKNTPSVNLICHIARNNSVWFFKIEIIRENKRYAFKFASYCQLPSKKMFNQFMFSTTVRE